MDKRFRAEDLIRVLNHHRHDWMNDLQVLFGYIQLNKQDKLRSYVELLSDKLYRESLVSKLGVPELVAYLALFRTEKRRLSLTVRPERDINLSRFGSLGIKVAESIMQLVDGYAHAAKPSDGESNELVLTLGLLDLEDASELVITFEYSGTYHPQLLIEHIQGTMEWISSMDGSSATSDLQEGAADIELRLHLT